MDWDSVDIQTLIQAALREDGARQDLTTQTLIPSSWTVTAAIRSKQKGVVAGLPFAERVFRAMNRRCRFRALVADGRDVQPGDTLATVHGPARSVLAAERPALNAIQHLSGIATKVHESVKRVQGTPTKIYDTRKTLPGWRLLQKYAVRCGGGTNHRFSLSEAILIKENHLMIARQGTLDWMDAVHRVHARRKIPIQMEIQTTQDLIDAMKLKPQLVLLDNLSPAALAKMIRVLRRRLPGVQIEISGGVKPEDLPALSRLGVERISMGRLTHTVHAFDCSLDIDRVYAN